MSDCPRCKKKISLLYLKQNCPHCDVNLRFYNFEENFYRDAKRAELSMAQISMFIAHIKASFIGSRLTIARLCVMLLPIISFLVPYGKVVLSQPFLNDSISLSALGLYGAYEDGYLPYIISMTGSAVNGNAFMLLAGVLGVIFSGLEFHGGSRIISTVSLIIGIGTVLVLALGRVPYAVVTAFLLLLLKGLLLCRCIKAEGR